MNLIVDYGNSRIKAGLFEQDKLMDSRSFAAEEELEGWLMGKKFDHAMVSSVNQTSDKISGLIEVVGKKLTMGHELPLPIHNRYATPATLGVDRLAAACGAAALRPQQDCLVIDLGTCINYEFVDARGNYMGGGISPGVNMRFEAMHTFTARLPLVKPGKSVGLIGNSTETCMQSGVMLGIVSEIEGIIARYKKIYPSLGVILCGGDAPFFENSLKQSIFVAPNLVLIGLNRILLNNVSR